MGSLAPADGFHAGYGKGDLIRKCVGKVFLQIHKPFLNGKASAE